MYGFDNDTYLIGPSVVDPAGLRRTPVMTAETVPAAVGWPFRLPHSLSRNLDDITRQLTAGVYEAMLTDPAVSSAYTTHKMGILAGGVKWVPAVEQPAWSKRKTPEVSPVGDTASAPGRQLTPDQAQARDVHDFVVYAFGCIRETFGACLFELLDAMAFGHKMAEMTFRLVEEGPHAGKLTFDRVKVKPNWAWRFVVDNNLNVLGFIASDPAGGYSVYPADKFVWLSWMPKDGDPRGTSILRAAYGAWNLKTQGWPLYYKFLGRFGSPGLDFELPETADSGASYPDIDATGALVAGGGFITAAQYYNKLMSVYQAGGQFVHPNGSKLQIAEPNSNGEALLKAFDLYDRQIMLAIEYQTRAALEAKHGSKADGEQAQDRKGVVIDYGREWLSLAVYRLAKQAVRLNYGDDAAERFTPTPTFGAAESHDRATLWTAAAGLGLKIGPSQVEDLCEEVGLPIPDVEADAKAAREAMKAMQATVAPADTGKGTAGGSTPPVPKPGDKGAA